MKKKVKNIYKKTKKILYVIWGKIANEHRETNALLPQEKKILKDLIWITIWLLLAVFFLIGWVVVLFIPVPGTGILCGSITLGIGAKLTRNIITFLQNIKNSGL